MQIKPRAYPHPVLSHFSDDLPNASFQPTIIVKGASSSYTFAATFKVSDPVLIDLVTSKTAEYALHIECQATRYRALHASFSEQFEFQILANALDGPVEVCSFILASQDIPTYSNPGFHKDYSNSSFSVHKGDTLAVGPDRTFIAEKKIDPLRRIPSIFIVVPDEKPDAPPLDVDTSGDKVRILLSKGNHDRYSFLRQSQPLFPVLCSMIIVPALVSILEEMRRSAEAGSIADFEDKRWYRVVANRLKSLGIDSSDPNSFNDSSVFIAQKLIGNPLEESLLVLGQYESTED